jgi:hypothetical protein
LIQLPAFGASAAGLAEGFLVGVGRTPAGIGFDAALGDLAGGFWEGFLAGGFFNAGDLGDGFEVGGIGFARGFDMVISLRNVLGV